MTSKASRNPAPAREKQPKTGMVEDIFARYKNEFVQLLRKEVVGLRAETGNQQTIDLINETQVGLYRNIQLAAQQIAVQESARFMLDNMLHAATFTHPHATLAHALAAAPTGGLALEFGVFSGTTLRLIADARAGSNVFGFDSFEGLPESWRSDFPVGAFAVSEPPDVPGAELVIGWFDDTLPRFLEQHPGPVDFLHVDCDIYSSTRTVLEKVGPRLRPGSIVMFDEFFNYPGWEQHEAKAWREYLQVAGTQVRYEAYTVNNEQVVARIVSV